MTPLVPTTCHPEERGDAQPVFVSGRPPDRDMQLPLGATALLALLQGECAASRHRRHGAERSARAERERSGNRVNLHARCSVFVASESLFAELQAFLLFSERPFLSRRCCCCILFSRLCYARPSRLSHLFIRFFCVRLEILPSSLRPTKNTRLTGFHQTEPTFRMEVLNNIYAAYRGSYRAKKAAF